MRARPSINATVATAFGCPFEGEQPADKVLGIVERYLRSASTASRSPTPPAWPTPGRSRSSWRGSCCWSPAGAPDAPLPQHARPRPRQCAGRLRRRRAPLRRGARRPRRLPVRARRHRQHLHRGPRQCLHEMGLPTGLDLAALIGLSRDLPRSSATTCRARSPRPAGPATSIRYPNVCDAPAERSRTQSNSKT